MERLWRTARRRDLNPWPLLPFATHRRDQSNGQRAPAAPPSSPTAAACSPLSPARDDGPPPSPLPASHRGLPSDYQAFIHTSRYARWDDARRRRETWPETVNRCGGRVPTHAALGHGTTAGCCPAPGGPLRHLPPSCPHTSPLPRVRIRLPIVPNILPTRHLRSVVILRPPPPLLPPAPPGPQVP